MSAAVYVRQRLLADSAVAAVVGTRIDLIKLPLNVTFPAITVQQVSSQHAASMDGPDLVRARVAVDAWANSFTTAHTVAGAVRACLDGQNWIASDSTEIREASRENVTDLFEEDSELYRVSSDYVVICAAEAA